MASKSYTMTASEFATFAKTLVPAIRADPMQEEFEEVAEIFREEQKRNFASEQDEFGRTWPPRKRKYRHPPLRRTLKMFDATTDRSSPGNLQVIKHRRMELGVRDAEVHYAKHHHYGAPRANLPRRRFLYLNASRLKIIHGPLKKAQVRVIQNHAGKISKGLR